MDPALRIVTKLPLEELWDHDDSMGASRAGSLTEPE